MNTKGVLSRRFLELSQVHFVLFSAGKRDTECNSLSISLENEIKIIQWEFYLAVIYELKRL